MARISKKQKDAQRKADSRARKAAQPDPEVETDLEIPVPLASMLRVLAAKSEKTLMEVVTSILEAYKLKLESQPTAIEWVTWTEPKVEGSVPTENPIPRWMTHEMSLDRVQCSLRESLYTWMKSFSRYSAGSILELAILDRCRPAVESEVEQIMDTWDLTRDSASLMFIYEAADGSHLMTGVFRPLEHPGDKYEERLELRREGWLRHLRATQESMLNAMINNTNARAANPDPRVVAQVRQLRENQSVLIESSPLGSENTYATMRAAPRWGME